MPARRDRAGSGTVRLAVAVLRSPNPNKAPDPVVYLEGGPGGSALSAVETWLTPSSPLLADRDVILVDQRGTGWSEPRLSCDKESRRHPEASTDDEVAALFAACRRRLTSEGVDLAAFSTEESAADVADLRTALGLGSVDLFGVSYGTRLALRVLADHPEGVRAAVLDSVYPVGVHGYEAEAAVLWDAISRLFAGCHADPACDAAFPDLERRVSEAIGRLQDQPVTASITDPETGEAYDADIAGADVVDALGSALYLSAAIPDLPRALDLIARGRVGEGYDLLQSAGATEPTDPSTAAEPPDAGRRPDDSDGLFYAVECAEEAPDNRRAGIDDRSAGVPEPWRSILVDSAAASLADCAAWDLPARPAPATRSSVPTLLLAGTYDPVTPPSWAEQAAGGLSSSRTVVVDGAGHAVIDAGTCPQQLVVSFLRDPGAVLAGTPTCTATPAFRTR
ncbi:MAG: alpha/beta fold hydrolase [Acidimicrobiales bacterium]